MLKSGDVPTKTGFGARGVPVYTKTGFGARGVPVYTNTGFRARGMPCLQLHVLDQLSTRLVGHNLLSYQISGH